MSRLRYRFLSSRAGVTAEPPLRCDTPALERCEPGFLTKGDTVEGYRQEIAAGQRFDFGANWAAFLRSLDEERITRAENSLRELLGQENLAGLRFLDVGSGSGLFSLAARRLGAQVHSFDYDSKSVACTRYLKEAYFQGDPHWTIQQGSVLDTDFVLGLGSFDAVYAWGVLHHTGQMWNALENTATLVRPGGRLFISIYNDQGGTSRRWTKVKKTYNTLPSGLRWILTGPSFLLLTWRDIVTDLLRLQPFLTFRNYKNVRGMSVWRDLIDWVGGYPFEVAKPEEVFEFCLQRHFLLQRMRTAGGSYGVNQFVFIYDPTSSLRQSPDGPTAK